MQISREKIAEELGLYYRGQNSQQKKVFKMLDSMIRADAKNLARESERASGSIEEDQSRSFLKTLFKAKDGRAEQDFSTSREGTLASAMESLQCKSEFKDMLQLSLDELVFALALPDLGDEAFIRKTYDLNHYLKTNMKFMNFFGASHDNSYIDFRHKNLLMENNSLRYKTVIDNALENEQAWIDEQLKKLTDSGFAEISAPDPHKKGAESLRLRLDKENGLLTASIQGHYHQVLEFQCKIDPERLESFLVKKFKDGETGAIKFLRMLPKIYFLSSLNDTELPSFEKLPEDLKLMIEGLVLSGAFFAGFDLDLLSTALHASMQDPANSDTGSFSAAKEIVRNHTMTFASQQSRYFDDLICFQEYFCETDKDEDFVEPSSFVYQYMKEAIADSSSVARLAREKEAEGDAWSALKKLDGELKELDKVENKVYEFEFLDKKEKWTIEDIDLLMFDLFDFDLDLSSEGQEYDVEKISKLYEIAISVKTESQAISKYYDKVAAKLIARDNAHQVIVALLEYALQQDMSFVDLSNLVRSSGRWAKLTLYH